MTNRKCNAAKTRVRVIGVIRGRKNEKRMKTKLIGIAETIISTTASIFFLGSSSTSYSQFFTIEPDNYTDGTYLTQIAPGITLSTADANNQLLPFQVTATYDSFHYAPTGSNVFGHVGIGFFNSDRGLRMDFSAPADFISLAFAGGDYFNPETGRLDIFNSAGTLLGSYLTQPLLGGRVETMTLSRVTPDVAMAVAYVPQGLGSFGRLDNLQVHVVPEPSGGVLMLLGTLLWLCRKPKPQFAAGNAALLSCDMACRQQARR